MATFNASSWLEGIQITPSVAAIPYVAIDHSRTQYNTYYFQGYGTIYGAGGEPYESQFTYYGSFDFSSEQAFAGSVLNAAYLATQSLGGFSISDLNLPVSIFLGDPSVGAAYLLAGSDLITGTSYDDFIEGYLGDDLIDGGLGNDYMHGGDGNDQIVGYGGNNALVGGTGNDIFYAGVSSGEFLQVIYDFNPSEDQLRLSGDFPTHTYMAINNGVAIFADGASNAFAFLAGISEEAFLQANIQPWA